MRALRTQIASAIQIIIQARRLPGGRRKVVSVGEITGMEGEQVQLHDLFTFEQKGMDSEGHAAGHFICHGIRPRVAERIENRGIKLSVDLFQRREIEIK
jgi:pilus assembly protein CpaF